ncbi:unnamed protein product [Brachionus calyciflorus]|uniref:Uncharacterized protein n=1 Tax=Brachionus calyciflorus TaxID=104777 RepID=A0A814F825_9BILA|nr:unnamed protein product [Brachionus calyciflorus]
MRVRPMAERALDLLNASEVSTERAQDKLKCEHDENESMTTIVIIKSTKDKFCVETRPKINVNNENHQYEENMAKNLTYRELKLLEKDQTFINKLTKNDIKLRLKKKMGICSSKNKKNKCCVQCVPICQPCLPPILPALEMPLMLPSFPSYPLIDPCNPCPYVPYGFGYGF